MPKNLMTSEEFRILRDWVHQVAAIRASMEQRPNDTSFQRSRHQRLGEIDFLARMSLTDDQE